MFKADLPAERSQGLLKPARWVQDLDNEYAVFYHSPDKVRWYMWSTDTRYQSRNFTIPRDKRSAGVMPCRIHISQKGKGEALVFGSPMFGAS